VEDALKLLVEAIAASGHIGKVKICLDAAASEFFVEENVYDMGYACLRALSVFSRVWKGGTGGTGHRRAHD
jgi:enolase